MTGEASIGPDRALQAVVTASRDRELLDGVGALVSNAIKLKLSQPGTGVQYGKHRASSPGDPPAVDTGRLRNSVAWAVGSDASGGYVEVGVSADYAAWLEYSTSRMAARPFFRPAVAETEAAVSALTAGRIVAAQVRSLAGLPRTILLNP